MTLTPVLLALREAARSLRLPSAVSLLIWVTLAVVVLYGFDFVTPKKRLVKLEGNHAALEVEVEDMNTVLRALTIGECIDRDERELQLMGLSARCDVLLSGQSEDTTD